MNEGVSLKEVRAAKERAAQVFSLLVGAEVAVGITCLGDDSFALNVNLTSEPDPDVELPTEVEGVPVQVEVVGKIRKR